MSSSSDIPPGIDNPLVQYRVGAGEDKNWLDYAEVRKYTNAFIVQDGKVFITNMQENVL